MRRVRFGHVANPFSLPVTVALEGGWFEEAGVALEVTPFANGSGTAAALAAGEIDAGVGGHIQTLNARLGGSDQGFIAPLGFERAPDHLTIALVAAPGIEGGSDLEGAAVGASARAAISELQLRIYMAAEGADYEELTLEAMPFGELAGALRGGTIAAASAPEPLASRLEADGLGRVIDRGSLSRALPAGERVMVTGIVAAAAWVDREPEAARALVAAVGRAVDELGPQAALHGPLFDRRLEPADLQRVFDLAAAHGLAARKVDAAELLLAPG